MCSFQGAVLVVCAWCVGSCRGCGAHDTMSHQRRKESVMCAILQALIGLP